MGQLQQILLCCLFVLWITECVAQTCTPNPDTCPDSFVCGPASICERIPNPEQDMMAYIILGVVLGVLVILVIVILIIGCGRWNWSFRMMNSIYGTNRKSTKRVTNITKARQVMRRVPKRRKMKLKLGIKKNASPLTDSNVSTSSKAFFVMGEDSAAADPTPILPQPAGPFVAKVDLDKSKVDVMTTEVANPSTSQTNYRQQSEGISRVTCPDVHDQYQIHGRNIDIHALVPMPSLYPQLQEVVTPQVVIPSPAHQMSAPVHHQLQAGHQINIHAPVPNVASTVHHQQVVAQPGLYPQLGHHTHAAQLSHAHPQAVHVGGHVHTHNATNLSPPAYQTMERKL